MSALREWVGTLMPALLIVLTTLSTLAAGFANLKARDAQQTADDAVEVAEIMIENNAEKSDSLRVAYRRLAVLEGEVSKLKTPAVRRVLGVARGTRVARKAESFSLWKPWTWG